MHWGTSICVEGVCECVCVSVHIHVRRGETDQCVGMLHWQPQAQVLRRGPRAWLSQKLAVGADGHEWREQAGAGLLPKRSSGEGWQRRDRGAGEE